MSPNTTPSAPTTTASRTVSRAREPGTTDDDVDACCESVTAILPHGATAGPARTVPTSPPAEADFALVAAGVRYPTWTGLSCSSMEYHDVRMISGLNRRQVLRGAAASGAGVLLSTGLLSKAEAAGERLAVEEYDVVVVGSG